MKTSCPYPYQADTVSAVVATGLAGLVAGSLAFGSFVDVRTLLQMVGDSSEDDENDKASTRTEKKKKKKKNIETVANLFPVWWPNGRDWMVPLMGVASLAHFATYYYMPKSTSSTCCASSGSSHGKISWLYSGFAIFGILPYTKICMGKDIVTLCDNTDNSLPLEQVAETTRKFGTKHHVRTVVAMAAFGLSLVSLVHLPHGTNSSGGAAGAGPAKK